MSSRTKRGYAFPRIWLSPSCAISAARINDAAGGHRQHGGWAAGEPGQRQAGARPVPPARRAGDDGHVVGAGE